MKKLTIEEYKEIVFNVLIKIDQICRENNLEYYLAYGTLIGAIRHNGFIPWDDDADIIMLRKDYTRLREIINSGSYGISFIDFTTTQNTIYPFGKICDNNTSVKEKNFIQIDDYGAFVDVFPLDYLPNDKDERKRYCKKYRRKEIIITHSTRTGYEKSQSHIRNLMRFIAFYICKVFNAQKMVRNMNEEFLRFDTNKTNYVGVPWAWGGLAYPEEFFIGHTEHDFEGHSFYIPYQYDAILKSRYNDYMKLPPLEQRVNLHSLDCYAK